MDNTSKIKCRKCNGNHLTIKCGKTENKVEETIKSSDNDNREDNKGYYKEDKEDNKRDTRGDNKRDTRGDNKRDNREDKKRDNRGDNRGDNKGDNRGDNKGDNRGDNKGYNKKSYTVNKVRMGNLPLDVSEDELRNLLYEWGNVTNIRVLNYDKYSTAYVEFRDIKEVDYLIEALHKTPFDNLIITVEKLDQ